MIKKDLNRDARKHIIRTIDRAGRGKKGTGRKLTRAEVNSLVQQYKDRTAEVEVNMDWEDYMNLIDIAIRKNANHAVDFAFRLGYMAGKESKE